MALYHLAQEVAVAYGVFGQVLVAASGPLAGVLEVWGHEQLFNVALNERKVHRAAPIVTGSLTGIGNVVGVLTWSYILSVTSYRR